MEISLYFSLNGYVSSCSLGLLLIFINHPKKSLVTPWIMGGGEK